MFFLLILCYICHASAGGYISMWWSRKKAKVIPYKCMWYVKWWPTSDPPLHHRRFAALYKVTKLLICVTHLCIRWRLDPIVPALSLEFLHSLGAQEQGFGFIFTPPCFIKGVFLQDSNSIISIYIWILFLSALIFTTPKSTWPHCKLTVSLVI